ncbi:hypothetical protein GPALN_007899 [Globodera pallida]|nr:hypothetical protein GPALN_007899 [Globodera pallida]
MAAARLFQTSRSLLFIVAVLLIYRGCPAEAELNVENFACAKKEAKLPGGMLLTKDDQIYIDSSDKPPDQWDIRGLLKDGNDGKLIITVIGEAPCGDSLKNVNIKQEGGGGRCSVGAATGSGGWSFFFDIPKEFFGFQSSSHTAKTCPGCKSFTLTCPVTMASVEGLPEARVFKVNLKQLALLSTTPCKWKGAYIDNVRFMLDDLNAENTEKCVEPGFPIMIVGIIAAVVGVLLIVAVGVGLLIWHRRRQQTPPPTIELGTKTASAMAPSMAAKTEKGASMWTFWQGGAKTTKQSVIDGPKTQWQAKGSTATNMGTSKGKQSGVEMTKFGASTMKAKQSGVEMPKSGTSTMKTKQSGVEVPKSSVGTMKAKQSGVEVPKSAVSKSGVTMPKSVAGKTTIAK